MQEVPGAILQALKSGYTWDRYSATWDTLDVLINLCQLEHQSVSWRDAPAALA